MKKYMITDKNTEATGIVSTVDENTIQIEWEDNKVETLDNSELKALLETDEYTVEEVEIDEDEGVNTAQASIQTHSTATPPGVEADGNPKTRMEYMLAVIGNLGAMDMETLAHFADESLGVIAAAGAPAETNGAAQNQATIQMKPSAAMAEALVTLEKEEQDAIFGATSLTEDAKTKMTTLFETAVSARVLAETVKVQELLEVKYDANLKEMSEGLVDKMDSFFNYVVREWITENEVAIESSLRTQLTNEFLEQLKTVFVENYIEIPEDKVDVLEAVVYENEELKKKINDRVNESLEKDMEIKALQKAVAVEKMTEGLTLPQKDKLRKLVAETEFTDADSFTKKVTVIKEAFLKVPSKESNILSEGIVTDDTRNVTSTDSAIAAAAKRLAR